MGKIFDAIDDELRAFIEAQKVFFVATAPLSADGHVNLSPKGLDTFRILGPHEVAYLDLTGSGIETLAHLRENGRAVFMFCAFEGRPRILRLHGRGEALEPGDARYAALRAHFPEIPGERAVIRVDVQRIADSCGWGVPLYTFERQRTQLVRFAEQLGPEKIAAEKAKYNAESLDGLPGVRA
jgi:predicted pyridoxine 5'-phosphate oxidase superfamily flavin-nucleotide-binding protein